MAPASSPGGASLIGREAELATLGDGLLRAFGGRGGLFSIAGEPGIGKTRLAATLAAGASERGARVVWGRCAEDAGAPAYWPWIQILRGCIRDEQPAALLALMGSGAADIARVVTQLRERIPWLADSPPLEPEQARFRFFDSVTTFLTNSARAQPLVLILDDLHRADTASLLLLEFLGRELHASPLLVVATYRDAEVDRAHPLARTLAALTRAQAHQPIALRGLEAPAVAMLIRALTGVEPAPALVSAVHRDSGGNPFFVIELARLETQARLAVGGAGPLSSREGGPHGLKALLDYRLGHLPPDCHRILTVAAVIGSEFSLTELERVDGLAGERLLEALEQAEVARVIAVAPGGLGRYHFTHALIREALYEEAPAARRLRLHRRVAEALEALYGAASGERLGQLAHHFVQAAPGGEVDKAVAYAQRAGDAAFGQLAYEEAARYYRLALQALELDPAADEARRCALLLSCGEAQNWSGEAEAARGAFRQAAALATRLGDAEGLARAALGFGAVAESGAGDANRIALLKQALAALGEGDSLLRVRTLVDLSVSLYWSQNPEDSIRLSEQALVIANRLAAPLARAHALNARREALWRPERLRERIAVGTTMRELAQVAADHALTLWAYRWQMVDSLECADRPAMDNTIAAHARLAQAVRQPLHLWYAARWQAMHALLDGRLGEAETLIERARALGRRTQRQDADALAIVQLAVLRRLQGRAAELEPAVRELVDRAPDPLVWRAGLAAIYADLEREADARRELERVAAIGLGSLPRGVNWLVTMTSLAQACAFLGDRVRAAALYDLLLLFRGQMVVVGAAVACHGAVAYYLGLLAATLTRWDEGQAAFDEALALHTKLGARPWIASTEYDYAALLFHRGRPGDRERALTLLTHALDIARELALTPLAERSLALRSWYAHGGAGAEQRGQAAGSGLRSAADGLHRRPHTLTAREREVVRLIAQGLTNRQIAATLVIAERTADAHVANILGKLGVHTRAQVAAWAVERGLHAATEL